MIISSALHSKDLGFDYR